MRAYETFSGLRGRMYDLSQYMKTLKLRYSQMRSSTLIPEGPVVLAK